VRSSSFGEAIANDLADGPIRDSFDERLAAGSRSVRLTPASSIKPRPVLWLWALRMALGTLVLFGGREGIGNGNDWCELTPQNAHATLRALNAEALDAFAEQLAADGSLTDEFRTRALALATALAERSLRDLLLKVAGTGSTQ